MNNNEEKLIAGIIVGMLSWGIFRLSYHRSPKPKSVKNNVVIMKLGHA